MFGMGFQEIIILMLGGLIVVVPFWKIFSRIGFPSALSILMLVPMVNLIVLFVVAFSKWPIDTKSTS